METQRGKELWYYFEKCMKKAEQPHKGAREEERQWETDVA